MDAPHVSGFIQLQPQQPKVFTPPERNAVDDPCGHVHVRGKSLQLNRTADPDRMSEASGTATQVYEDYFALFGERMRRIETAEGDRNGTRNSSAVPFRSFLR